MEQAALYIRVSTGGQKDNYSPETQRELGTAYIAEHGYSLKPEHVFQEVYSAKDSASIRPEFNRLQQAIIRGEVSVVVALKADRMFRDILDGAHFLTFLREQKKARLEFVQEDHEDSSLGTIMYLLKLYGAESQWDAIKEASGRGRKARMESGKPLVGRKPLYGYRWAPEEKAKTRLIPYEPEAKTVRLIFRQLVEGGSLVAIVRQFRAEGRPGPSGGEWQATTLSRMIKNEAYAGRAFANRWQTSKNDAGKQNQQIRPKEAWIPLPDGVFPALVDTKTWDKANRQVERNRTTEGPRRLQNPEAFLLRNGYARCVLCGRGLSAKNRKGRPSNYQCTQNILVGSPEHCTGVSINAAELDAAVWERVRTVLTDPDWCKAELSKQADTAVIDADLAAIEATLKDVAQRQGRLIRNLELVDGDSAAEILSRLGQLKVEKTHLQTQYHSTSTRRANLKQTEDFMDRLIARATTVDAMTYQEKRAILDEFGVRAIVHPKAHAFRYEVDFAIEIDGLTVMAGDYYGENNPDLTGEPVPGQATFGLHTDSSMQPKTTLRFHFRADDLVAMGSKTPY